MNHEEATNQLDWINELLDALGIPRKTPVGATYSTYGRVSLMADELKEFRQRQLIDGLKSIVTEMENNRWKKSG